MALQTNISSCSKPVIPLHGWIALVNSEFYDHETQYQKFCNLAGTHIKRILIEDVDPLGFVTPILFVLRRKNAIKSDAVLFNFLALNHF